MLTQHNTAGHLIALEHLFEEYEAWKASTDQDTIKTRTGHVEYSISVLCKLLQSDNSSHHRLEAASEAQDAVEEARLHSKDRRGHVQKTLVHLGFAHLIDTAIDIPVECHDFPTWWWNAPMRPSCTNIAAQITTMKPDLVVGTHAGGICFISGTGNEIQSSPTISEEDDNRVHHQPQATFEYIDMVVHCNVDVFSTSFVDLGVFHMMCTGSQYSGGFCLSRQWLFILARMDHARQE